MAFLFYHNVGKSEMKENTSSPLSEGKIEKWWYPFLNVVIQLFALLINWLFIFNKVVLKWEGVIELDHLILI